MSVYLPAWGLLSKWGFHDGDVPDDYLDWLEDQGLPEPTDWHAVLRQLVRTRLMPLIREQVVLVDIQTIHNPIRADFVYGQKVDHYDSASERLLADVEAQVPFAEVYEVQRAIDEVAR